MASAVSSSEPNPEQFLDPVPVLPVLWESVPIPDPDPDLELPVVSVSAVDVSSIR